MYINVCTLTSGGEPDGIEGKFGTECFIGAAGVKYG